MVHEIGIIDIIAGSRVGSAIHVCRMLSAAHPSVSVIYFGVVYDIIQIARKWGPITTNHIPSMTYSRDKIRILYMFGERYGIACAIMR